MLIMISKSIHPLENTRLVKKNLFVHAQIYVKCTERSKHNLYLK